MARRGVYGRRHVGFQIKIWETGKREAALMQSSEILDPAGPEASSFFFSNFIYSFLLKLVRTQFLSLIPKGILIISTNI